MSVTLRPVVQRPHDGLLVIRSKHVDDGRGRCLSGCGAWPCALRLYYDRIVESWPTGGAPPVAVDMPLWTASAGHTAGSTVTDRMRRTTASMNLE